MAVNRNSDKATGSVKESVDQDEGDVLEWTIHPVKRRPLTSTLVTLFIVLISVVVYMAAESFAFAALALVVLFASLAKFYFPTTYRLNDRCITIKTTTQTVRKNWSTYRNSYADKNGVLLSPFTHPSRLENFRGLYLIFADNRDEVIAFIRPRLNDDTTQDTVENKK